MMGGLHGKLLPEEGLNVKERYNLQGLVKESMDMPFTVALTKEEDSYAYWMQQEDNCL